MSNVSSSHLVQKLDKSSKALSDQRMARIIAKKDKHGKYESEFLTESKFVSLPVISELHEDHIEALLPHIVGMIENAQNALIRELVANEGCTSVHDDQINIEKCIQYLDDEAKGNRVTGEYLSKWFADTYSDAATEFVVKLCKFTEPLESMTEAQLEVVSKKVNVLTSMFAGFASGKYSPDIPKCKAMLKFGEFIGGDNHDARMQNYLGKAQSVLAVKEAELSMDALGF